MRDVTIKTPRKTTCPAAARCFIHLSFWVHQSGTSCKPEHGGLMYLQQLPLFSLHTCFGNSSVKEGRSQCSQSSSLIRWYHGIFPVFPVFLCPKMCTDLSHIPCISHFPIIPSDLSHIPSRPHVIHIVQFFPYSLCSCSLYSHWFPIFLWIPTIFHCSCFPYSQYSPYNPFSSSPYP